MAIYSSIASLYPDAITHDKFDERYLHVYALQSTIYPSVKEWIFEKLSFDEKILILKTLNHFIEEGMNYGDFNDDFDGVKKELQKNLLEQLKRGTLEQQLKFLPLVDNDFHYKSMIPLLHSLEDYHSFMINVISNSQFYCLSDIAENYMNHFLPQDLKSLFLDASYNAELKSKLYRYLPENLKEFLHQETFSAQEVLDNFQDVALENMKIVDKIEVKHFLSTGSINTLQLKKTNLLTIKSLEDITALNWTSFHPKALPSFYDIMDKSLLMFYQECAIEHGFLDEFYRFALIKGDTTMEKTFWDSSLDELMNEIGEYIHEHSAEVSAWHPLIDAVLNNKTYAQEGSEYERLEHVMNCYIQKYLHLDVKNEESINELLDVKVKNIYLDVWKQRQIMEPNEVSLHV